MRTLIVTAFVSVDGVMEAPGGETGYRNAGWTFQDIDFDPAAYEIKGREQAETSVQGSLDCNACESPHVGPSG
ncbi:hypothetical protein UG55_102927 [Frankia sp. EI5c]|nr:hypothetical protein UG55_102927 [Frankia sp. EI5c]